MASFKFCIVYISDIFRMLSDTFDAIPLVMSIISFFSTLCQLVSLRFPILRRGSRILVISLAIVNSLLHLIFFGFSHTYHILHLCILILFLLTFLLQVVMLVTHPKRVSTQTSHEPV